jgi:hypothetical protein
MLRNKKRNDVDGAVKSKRLRWTEILIRVEPGRLAQAVMALELYSRDIWFECRRGHQLY